MTQIMCETVSAHAVYVAIKAVLSLNAVEPTTKVVMCSGDRSAYCTYLRSYPPCSDLAYLTEYLNETHTGRQGSSAFFRLLQCRAVTLRGSVAPAKRHEKNVGAERLHRPKALFQNQESPDK